MKALYLLLEVFAVVIVSLVVTKAANAAISDGFDYPVGKPDGIGYKNSQDFGEYNSDFNKYHLGEDWNGKFDVNKGEDCNSDKGDPVYAISNGKVAYAGYYSESWGNVITIHHALPTDEYGRVVESLYAHLETVLVSDGDIVKRGQKIGTMGKTGISAGDCAHLHFEVRSDESIDADHGYSITPGPEGWLDPSDFIDSHTDLGSSRATDVRLTGDIQILYDWSDGYVKLTTYYDDAIRIDNFDNVESGRIYLRLEACDAPTLPATCHRVAQYTLPTAIGANANFDFYDTGYLLATAPSNGTYYMVLKLVEELEKERVVDHRFFEYIRAFDGGYVDRFIDSLWLDDYYPRTAYEIKRNSSTDGSIYSSEDDDRFLIQLEKYGKLKLRSKGMIDLEGVLYTDDFTFIVFAETCSDGINFCINRELDPGTYYLKVTASSKGLYSLESTFTGLRWDDFGNTRGKAHAISPNSITDGSIDYKKDVDYFRVQLTEYGKLEMRTKGATDTKGSLYKKDGTLLATADDNCSDGINFCIKRKLKPGTYYLKVKASSKGSYKLKSEFSRLVADDFGNSRGKAYTIAPNSITDGTIGSKKDVDYFKFRMSRNGYIGLVNNHNTEVVFELLKKSGAKIRSRVCDIYAGSPCLAESLKEGTYYIKVSGYRGATGPYVVGLVTKYGNYPDISY